MIEYNQQQQEHAQEQQQEQLFMKFRYTFRV